MIVLFSLILIILYFVIGIVVLTIDIKTSGEYICAGDEIIIGISVALWPFILISLIFKLIGFIVYKINNRIIEKNKIGGGDAV